MNLRQAEITGAKRFLFHFYIGKILHDTADILSADIVTEVKAAGRCFFHSFKWQVAQNANVFGSYVYCKIGNLITEIGPNSKYSSKISRNTVS